MIERHTLATRAFYLPFLSAIIALGALSVDSYLPAIPQMAEHFEVSISAINLTLTFFLLGIGLGQFLGGAVSDQLGRRPVGLLGLLIFALCSLLIPYADSIQQLYGLRFIQALGAGFAAVICMAQIRDVFPVEQLGKKFANVTLVMLVGPMLAPIIGVFLMQWGWQTIFSFLAIAGTLGLTIYSTKIPETLNHKKQKLTTAGLFSGYANVTGHRLEGKLTAIWYLAFSIAIAGVFMSYLTNAASIFVQHYGLSEIHFALVFAASGGGMMIGNRIAYRLMDQKSLKAILKLANSLQVGLLLLMVILIALTFDSFVVIATLLFLIISVAGMQAPAVSASMMKFFDRDAGSATSLLSTARFIGGGIIGGLSTIAAQGSLLVVAIVMLASALAAAYILTQISD